MPMRKLPDGTYLIKPPSNNLCIIRAEPSGTICYSGIPHQSPVTLTTPLPDGNTARLLVHAGA